MGQTPLVFTTLDLVMRSSCKVRLLATYFCMKAVHGFHPSGHAEHVLKFSPNFSAAAKKVRKKPARFIACSHQTADENPRKLFIPLFYSLQAVSPLLFSRVVLMRHPCLIST